MSIDQIYLHTAFMQSKADTLVHELNLCLASIPVDTYKIWFVVTSINDDTWSIFTIAELVEAARRHDKINPSCILNEIPELLIPCRAVGRLSMGIGQARQEMRKSHKQRLLVMEEKEPVGILHSEVLGGIFGGFPWDIFRHVDALKKESSITYRCPLCNRKYDFRELVTPGDKRLICPSGHIVLENS